MRLLAHIYANAIIHVQAISKAKTTATYHLKDELIQINYTLNTA